jgi:hypothetical protein
MLIDKSYFTGKLELPNVEQGDVNADLILNNDNLDRLINEYEFKYLIDVFGVTIAKEILAVIEPDGTITPGSDQKYFDLIEGVDDWLGLRYEVSTVKYSQVANYVYCQYLNQYETQLSNLGNSVNEIEKGTRISNWSKFNESWREMMLQRQIRDYNDLYFYGYAYRENPFYTLYEYLSNSADWSTSKFRWYENTNSFNL